MFFANLNRESMNNEIRKSIRPKNIFWKCGACSNAFCNIVNKVYEKENKEIESAADPLAGGIAQQGYQCGMLWGAALGTGAESFRKYHTESQAIEKTIEITGRLIDSYNSKAGSINCSDITETDFNKKAQFIKYMLKTISRGFFFSPCFNFIKKWTPDALDIIEQGFSVKVNSSQGNLKSCASELAKQMNASSEEVIIVSGFAGGLGLSGNACGALAAKIWFTNLKKVKAGNYKSVIKDESISQIMEKFYQLTNYEIECENICGKKFGNAEEHTKYINSGGCKELIEKLAEM